MRNGDIILIKVNKFTTWYRFLLGKLIQLFDRTYYHHCAIYIDGKLHEADGHGVVEIDLSKYDNDNYAVIRPILELSKQEEEELKFILNAQLGKPYDYWGTLFYQLIYRLTKLWFGPKNERARAKLFCSEHCILPYHKLRGYFRKSYLISPGDILRSSGYFKIVLEK